MLRKISIITPSYNSGELLRLCTQSIYAQSGLNENFELEHIIIDGYSTDGSLDFLTSEFGHSKIISQYPDGVYSAMNLGLSIATGEIIAFLNADDIYIDPTVFLSVMNVINQDNTYLVYGDLMIVNRSLSSRLERNWIAGNFVVDKLRRGWMPPHPTLFVKRNVFDSVGNFNEAFRISGDYDWILRAFLTHKNNVSYLPKHLVMMRSGGLSSGSNLQAFLDKNFEDLAVIRQNKIGGYVTLVLKKLRKLNQIIWMR